MAKIKRSKEEEPKADASKPTAGKVIGDNFGWTGKLPATLLNEYAQKQKWGRVDYKMHKRKSAGTDGFVCTVGLSWVNPRTNETIHVDMTPDLKIYQPKPTTNEARHFGATYALHRINFIKNMKMVLPSIFASYWGDLESERQATSKQNKEKHDQIYNANPFAVVLDQRLKAEKLAKEKEAKAQSELKIKKPTINIISTGQAPKKPAVKASNGSVSNGSAKIAKPITRTKQPKIQQLPSFPKKVWDNAPFIDFPSDIRTSMEQSIRKHIDWILEEDLKLKVSLENSNDSATHFETLKQLEFRDSHIREAFKYTSTFVDALEWLLFHLPEDDLPQRFSKTDKDTGVSLTISKNIQYEYLMKRLAQSGFDEDEILQTLEKNGGNEILTCIKLTHKLAMEDTDETETDTETDTEELVEDPESHELWVQEVEGIELLGANSVEFVDGSNQEVVNVSLNADKVPKGLFSLRLFKSQHYPNELPGIQIVVTDIGKSLANYIKLSIVRQACEYIQKNGFIGDCFLYCIVEWLEMNIAKVIDNPGPLVDENHLKLSKQIADTTSTNTKSKKDSRSNGRTKTLSKDDISKLQSAYESKLASAKMKASLKQRSSLPAWKKKDQLVNLINSNKVTLVTGETGSGKSTQIVQFILDDLNSRGMFQSKIICTQPRRISTIGLAERISDERIDSVGKETGFIIRGENKTTKDTRLSFVTTGVLLRMLQSYLSSPNASNSENSIFSNLDYIFIDEVHERSIDSDFLLIILKRIIDKFPNLRVILMSATINLDKFKNFFKSPMNHIHIEGRTFPIEDYYLDSILDDLDYTIKTYEGDIIRPKASSTFFQNGTLNYDLIAKLCLQNHHRLEDKNDNGSILIFLPGIMEISKCIRNINDVFQASGADCWCLPLHSALSSADQKRVFQVPKRGTRKIVVSTNIAETSITIPDCVIVIDSGRSKQIFFDSKINTTRLVENWCSKAEIGQRRGRSGRITNGTCFHLYTKEVEEKMIPQPIPEIKRTRLENLFLIVKSMGIGNVEAFLNEGLDAPDQSSLTTSKKFLSDIGALDEESLTHLGKYLSFIPTDLQSGKLMILGCIFGCLDVCLTLAAISSTGSPILNSHDMRDKIKQIKTKFANGQGDLIGMVNAYNEYESQTKGANKFIQDNCLSYLTLKEIRSVRVQYISILKELGFVPMSYNEKSPNSDYTALNRNRENFAIVRAVITGAYYPQISQVQLPDPKFFKSNVGTVEIDPDAKKNKYWLRNPNYQVGETTVEEGKEQYPATRAFIHPSSVLFTNSTSDSSYSQDILDKVTGEDGEIDYAKARKLFDLTPQAKKSSPFAKAPFVVYRDSNHTDKFYLREVTPTSTLATLLFGGEIGYDLVANRSSPGIVLDGWLPIRTWCKNAVLIKRLRKLLDGFIEQKLSDPYQKNLGANQDILRILERALTV